MFYKLPATTIRPQILSVKNQEEIKKEEGLKEIWEKIC